LQKAAIARKERAEVKNRLKRGAVTLSEVIKDGSTDDVIGKMKVSALLESLPGVGKVRAKQIMERLGIAESRRVRGLGALGDLTYYEVLYNFRLAVLLEGIYQRSLRDPTRPDQVDMGERVFHNVDRALALIGEGGSGR